MGTLSLAEVEIEGTRSIVERTLIKFPASGMVLINGSWAGSEVSSGSGKSTIPIAIAQGLDCCDLPATVLKSWYATKQFVRVRLTDPDGSVYDIIRNPKLKMIVNGVDKGSGTAAEDKFKEVMRAPSELIKALTYRPQRERGKWITRTDAQNKEFLSTLLNLSALEVASDDLSRENDKSAMEITSLTAQIASSEATATSLAGAKPQIPEAESRYAEAQRRYNLLVGTDNRAAIQAQVVALSGEISRINSAISRASVAQSENRSIREQCVGLQSQIETLTAQICAMCHREWDQGQACLDSLKERMSGLLKRMEANLVTINSVTPMHDALPKLQADLAAENRKLGEMQAPLSDAYASAESSRRLLEQLTAQARQHDIVLADMATKKSRILAIQDEAEVSKHAAAVLSRNGFLSEIFDEVLAEIETRANAMIGKIPNVAAMTVQICSSHETKSGTTKKTIVTKVFQDGSEIPFKGVSGGQQCSLELFTDLAVSETIRKRSGSPVNWLFLDEAMDGLDVATKKAALAVIRQSVSGTVIVIDHSTEIKESFDQVITLTFDGRVSRVA